MTKEAFVDQNMCIGCGICVKNLPDVFHLNDRGLAECFDPRGATEEDIQLQAIDVCPVTCIGWRETCVC
ncbi:ferredoxin [Oryzomonas rubra]|uniref:Ferredoxin n=1 Tax=Oryzomonas rubra TaxID=2509454 RepID=A0A5A9X6B1_9BACT|nr:ferredoxin [Oryzomonas rubra]KAA0888314.1 ferredoxin [Oryzomonas rubra]